MSLPFIPASLIDNQPVTVQVQLPAAWIARAFTDWLEEHAEEFADKVLANDGVHIEWTSTIEYTSSNDMAVVFSRTR